MSQATCKVCQNKILIRRPPEGTPVDQLVSAFGIPDPRSPIPTPTRISEEENEPTVADPMPPSTLAAPLPGEGSALTQLPEQELSNSWREAIVDNRTTVAMLKKMGLPGPEEGSTASGPAVVSGPPIGSMPPAPAPAPFAMPTPAAAPANTPPPVVAAPVSAQPAPSVPALANVPPFAPERPLELATGRTAGTITNVQAVPSSRMPSPPRPAPPEVAGASKFLSFAAGVSGAGIAAAQVWNGSWGAGLSGWLAFGAACFIAVAGLLNSLLRGPGLLAVFGVGVFATLAAGAGMLAVFLTGGPRTRVMTESHPFLAPLAAYEMHLAKGTPEPTPAPTPESAVPPDGSPDASAVPSVEPSPSPSTAEEAAEVSPATSASPTL